MRIGHVILHIYRDDLQQRFSYSVAREIDGALIGVLNVPSLCSANNKWQIAHCSLASLAQSTCNQPIIKLSRTEIF